MAFRLIHLILACAVIGLVTGCSKDDPMQEIRQLEADGKPLDAKMKFRALVEKEQDPNLERQYIQFLFKHKQYRDFKNSSDQFLGRYPNDKDVTTLQFEYYAKLAADSERAKNYEDALYYVVNKLLSPEYKDYRKWENRQALILQKWFEQAKEQNDANLQKKVMIEMKNLKFENLARTLDNDLYESIKDQVD